MRLLTCFSTRATAHPFLIDWEDFKINTLTNASPGQNEEVMVNAGTTLALLHPALYPVAVGVTAWDMFVFAGEKITGRPASDSGQYIEELKNKLRKEVFVPGFQFYPAVNPTPSGSSGASTKNGGSTTQSGGGSGGQSSKTSSGGGSGYINTPGLLPRSVAPVGQYGGKPIYCWGYCG